MCTICYCVLYSFRHASRATSLSREAWAMRIDRLALHDLAEVKSKATFTHLMNGMLALLAPSDEGAVAVRRLRELSMSLTSPFL